VPRNGEAEASFSDLSLDGKEMGMELRRLSTTELSQYLEAHVTGLRDLDEGNRDVIVRMAHRLLEREVAPRFILSTIRHTVDLMGAPEVPPGLDRPATIEQTPSGERQTAARRLVDHTRATLREARSARRSNEVRRMRCVLRSIDRGYLREALGDEGERLCGEIDTALSRLMLPVRRGRPRAQRLAA